MDKEMLQFNALLEARSVASGLDLSNVSEETRMRVAAMLRSRRERMMQEEKEYLEDLRRGEAEAKFSIEIGATMTEDEKTARYILLRQEEKAFERIVKVFDEQFQHLSAGMLTLRQQKEIEASRAKKLISLEHELNKQRFYIYMEKHNKQRQADQLNTTGASSSLSGSGGGKSKKGDNADASSPAAQMHRLTAVLRRAYSNSAPAFATDPEELWKRGQTLPPTAAASATAVAGVDLPAYHELGAKLREKYAKHASSNGVGAAIGTPQALLPGAGAASMLGQRGKSSATHPHQQSSPFATAIHQQLANHM